MNRFGAFQMFFVFFVLCAALIGSEAANAGQAISIPAAGNCWVIGSAQSEGPRVITRNGVENWTDPESVIRAFFRVERTGEIRIAVRARVESGVSRLEFELGGAARTVTVSNTGFESTAVGSFTVNESGYQRLDIRGVEKSGEIFADITDILIEGEAAGGEVFYVGDDFYFGRRGPSVHLRFEAPAEAGDITYFYSELRVPKGEDVVGSYFMANGFGAGYFGIQVNSLEERRILFSVWSPFKTDNPGEIPEEQRIRLLKKGEGVYTGKFGGEGSGGQSYRRYFWKPDTNYRFLLKGQPAGNNHTDYTAWFYAPETGEWELIASFRRPDTDSYLTRLYSFLENFIPAAGRIARKGLYGSQWVYDSRGDWHELTEAGFTADATARKKARLDYTGGTEGKWFYLKNCGFFNERSEIGITLAREAKGSPPEIDFAALP